MFGLVPALYYSTLEEFFWKVMPCSLLESYQCVTTSAMTESAVPPQHWSTRLHGVTVCNHMHVF
jgi:hypothetical protein